MRPRPAASLRALGVLSLLLLQAPLLLTPPLSPSYLSKSSNLKFSDVPHGMAALGKVPALGWIQVVALAAAMELVLWPAKDYSSDYGTGYFGFALDAEEKKFKLEKEISNGRLAMCGIFGLMIGDSIVPGNPYPTVDGIGIF